jgi:hypothetical protein
LKASLNKPFISLSLFSAVCAGVQLCFRTNILSFHCNIVRILLSSAYQTNTPLNKCTYSYVSVHIQEAKYIVPVM